MEGIAKSVFRNCGGHHMLFCVATIKRGVSLYCYQEEFFLRTMSLEDCIAHAASVGALGIEIIPEQSFPGFPHLTDEQIAQWHAWMEQYGTTTGATDLFLDTKRYPDRWLTHEEQVASFHARHRHRRAAGRDRWSGRSSTPRRRSWGGRAVRRDEGRPAAARGARAVPLRAPVDPRAPRGDARRGCAGARPDARHGHLRRAVPPRGHASARCATAPSRSWSTTSSRPTTTTATPTR